MVRMIQQADFGGASRPSQGPPRRRRRGVPTAWPAHGRRHDRAASAIRIRIALALALLVALAGGPLPAAPTVQAATDTNPSFEIIASDLEFIFDQIRISEHHAAGGPLLCPNPLDQSGTCVPHPLLPWGLRTVDGSFNNLVPGRTHFGSADQVFPRMMDADMRSGVGDPVPEGAPQIPGTSAVCLAHGTETCYHQTSGFTYDAQPRVASNLIVDLTANNPAAVAAAGRVEGSATVGADGRLFIPNVAPDEGLSAPFNTWMTFFGQFFDHGLDLVNKGGSGTVVTPLLADDPLIDDPDMAAPYLMLTRATNKPGRDGTLGTADDVRDHNNQTTPFVDQNQTYTSHPSHQVFLREYVMIDGRPQATGHLLEGAAGGLATWADIKAQAETMLGITLSDHDVGNVPEIRTDPYGNFTGNVPQLTGNRTGHAFLDDIAHTAAPRFDALGNPLPGHDTVLLDKHFITGDGRGNENIGLTAVHHIFHAEHNRLVGHIQGVLDANPALLARYQNEGGAERWDYGQRLFQAARYVTEMEYQHLVFEEFARTIQPLIDVLPANETGYHTSINAAITAEFAHVVYRFGHSMLTETIAREGVADISLLDAFLNPDAFTMNGTLTAEEAAGSIVMGMVNQPGSGIDEFVTETLRNELLGLPLDLATINLMRGRDAGVPGLQAARNTFYSWTGDPDLMPYEHWVDFGHSLKHPESLVNFVAAYGTHPDIVAAATNTEKRDLAQALVDADDPFLYTPSGTSGLGDVDFWIGGLAEAIIPFQGMLGPTFNYVFESQLESLQNGDRFYYLSRNIGLNLFHQLEANSFSAIIRRTTSATHLPAEIFTTPDRTFDLGGDTTGLVFERYTDGPSAKWPTGWRYVGGEHINMHGTTGNDRMRSGIGDDALWGYDGDDYILGGAGANSIIGGAGNDVMLGAGGDDNIKGGAGNDALHGGSGDDLLLGGSGKDFIVHGSEFTTSFGGLGDDFILGSSGTSGGMLTGNEGNDWLQGLNGSQLLSGDNSNGFQNDPNGGHDVLWGGPGNDDMDAEGGDDIMIASEGSDRFEGMLGFDWVTYRGVAIPAVADMKNVVFQPPDIANFRSRFDLVEGLSGWDHGDVLRGYANVDDTTFADGTGHVLTQEHLDRVVGLRALLGGGATPVHAVPFMTPNTENNILLGGGGSDIIEGRGGSNFIDGSAWLRVQLAHGGNRYDSMSSLVADVFSGRIDPGDIQIVREIVFDADEEGTINTAVYSDAVGNYEIIENLDGTTTVTHITDVGGGDPGDPLPSDTLRNIQRLQFTDPADPDNPVFVNLPLEVIEVNAPATGQPVIVGAAVEGQALSVDLDGIADEDGIDTTSFTYEWQVEANAGAEDWGPPVNGNASEETFTPTADEVGLRLRVIVNFHDLAGVQETVTSDPTEAVIAAGALEPVASVEQTSLEFGGSVVGVATAAQDITVSNVGTAAFDVASVTIAGVNAASFDVVSNGCTATLAPEQSCTISVGFIPQVQGSNVAEVQIAHTASNASPLTVAVSGTGLSTAFLSMPDTVFNPIRLNQSRTTNVRITNTGTADLVITSVTTSGAPFTATTGTCPAAIRPVRSCNLSVTFSPTTGGTHTGTLTVVSNASNSPTTANLSGTTRN